VVQFQYVDAHIPSRTKAFTTKLTATAVHVSNVANGAFRPIRLRLMSVTIAITVVTGVMKRNHSAKTSAKFRGNQCGMRRSIGNAKRNAKNPNKAGKHHQSENQILARRGSVSFEFATVDSSTSDILTGLE
jgi:hypothetical protein